MQELTFDCVVCSMCSPRSTPQLVPINCTFGYGTAGTDACYYLDSKQDVPDANQTRYFLFGSEQRCKIDYPDLVANSHRQARFQQVARPTTFLQFFAPARMFVDLGLGVGRSTLERFHIVSRTVACTPLDEQPLPNLVICAGLGPNGCPSSLW